ncbi:uncharacterized protein YhdP [Pseudarthrobacter sulfonivorans]|nr:uncharacterized protein YhdP [Pseudarthrobacter sulfonivorans]
MFGDRFGENVVFDRVASSLFRIQEGLAQTQDRALIGGK